ncbi:NFU1 iron-sulfur cluster scaffold-like, mitochondrial [Hondaea fermentalgiana]|uniref:NFU1 iron-sulfur cluster scaffold-like, mitochondrial n=1 Tax=Hondaea fermentalgiana TaxID=2315210 RepID=A0A2R5GJN5_9STRA|nr:NFU1 iron-sulfur cluster scaffold-like, mitochondrial [Hondaea fermentalgiana]|eukprot:GBG31102.1 NFU1 iron-sulfur cluster scaffold-like, mitochondrial [Hondaea fermentalgiana]
MLREATPNPRSMKFTPADGRLRLLRPRAAATSVQVGPASEAAALAHKLAAPSIVRELQNSGVGPLSNALVTDDFVSVTVRDDVEDDEAWDAFAEAIGAALERDLGDEKWKAVYAESAVVDDGDDNDQKGEEQSKAESAVDDAQDDADADDEVESLIKEILDERIRPNLLMDGGDVEYRGFDAETGTVKLRLVGACVSCPSSTVTLRFSVKNLLVHMIDEVREVEQVFDEEDLVSDYGESWTG